MNSLVKVISNEIDKTKRRLVKVLRLGNSDVQTSLEVSPYGIDSNPIKDMVAVYSETKIKGKTVIIGYINKNQKAEPGEFRAFATDKSGTEKFYVWMKATGIMEIGGDTNWAVKYTEMKAEFDKLKNNFNQHLLEFNTHIHSGGVISGNTGPCSTPSSQTNTSDMSQAKNTKIKTIG